MNALTYITRRCPRNCKYCALKKDIKSEMNKEEWKEAFQILKNMGVKFNLILGNECWLLGKDLIEIIRSGEMSYAVYTTAPRKLFLDNWTRMFGTNGIDNLSCGVDYPPWVFHQTKRPNDILKKSFDGWRALKTTKLWFPHVDCQATITVGKHNLKHLRSLVLMVSTAGIFVGVNFIHWNKDGNFDFFPKKENLKPFIFSDSDIDELRRTCRLLTSVERDDVLIQNIEMLDPDNISQLANMEWHCKGDPYGGPTVDADGSLRVCGYRKGLLTSRFTIFDLPASVSAWREAVKLDAAECPGCGWSYPWMYRYWHDHDKSFGDKVFANHAGKHISKDKWSTRRKMDETD